MGLLSDLGRNTSSVLAMTNLLKTELPTLPAMPAYILTPLDWAGEAMRRASEYAGMPEGAMFLVEARRYLALNARIKELETEIETFKENAGID